MFSLLACICMLEWTASVFGISYGLWNAERDIWDPTWWFALIMMFCIPILNEIGLSIKGCCCRRRVMSPTYLEDRNPYKIQDSVPILYSKRYNMHFFGLEKANKDFDAYKGKRIWQGLINAGIIEKTGLTMKLHEPSFPSREFLQFVVSPWYMFTLNYSLPLCRITGMPFCIFPGWLLRMRILDT